MRISDWSSDVCSSDLPDFSQATDTQRERMQRLGYATNIFPHLLKREDIEIQLYRSLEIDVNSLNPASLLVAEKKQVRSEEHTSELQSLMRISYAVFCLKKQKQIKHDS